MKKKIDEELTAEDIHKFVYTYLYPEALPNNINTKIDGQFVTMEYFNAKLFLLMGEIDYISKCITDIKSYYKQMSGMLDKITNLILTVMQMYFVKNPEDSVPINIEKDSKKEDIKEDKTGFNSDDNIKKKNSRKHKKKDKTKHLQNDIVDGIKKVDEEKDDLFDNLDLDIIDFNFRELNESSENKIIVDKNDQVNSTQNNKINDKNLNLNSSISNTEHSCNIKHNLIKNNGENTTTDYKTNFFFLTKDKQTIYDIYYNINGSAGLDRFFGIEEHLGEGKSNFYVYFHCKRRKRIKTIDLEDAKEINVEFRKINIKEFLKAKGDVFYDPLGIKEAFFGSN
jgi:hypothetical protein